jgi:outer membrane protein OmpA-like peptidoglycan-associated protein
MKNIRRFFTIMLATTILLSCNNMNKTTKGGIIGAGAGGAVGGVIGNRVGNTAAGAIIGAAVGGAAGAVIGRYMDKQAEELRRDLENAKVERVGEGIKITFNSGILFDVNSAGLRQEAKTNLEDLAKTLQKYDDTEVLIEGHTDNTGTEEYNQKLSENRAQSVASYIQSLGVKGARIQEEGYGEVQPVDANETEAGRQSNRRVEVAIYANKKLKKAAEKGDIGDLEESGS